jgi:two-component system response regulator LytT
MAKVDVLIVEDESIVAKDLQLSLKKLNYNTVGVADNAEDAYKLAKSTKPDIVLMDIQLKGTETGIDAANNIKEDFNIPVIFITANTDDKTFEGAKGIGPNGFIVKPFKEIDLKTTIEVALHKFKIDDKIKVERDLLHSIAGGGGNSKDTFFVKNKSKFIKFRDDQIICIEALKDYVTIHTTEGSFTMHSTMKEIVDKLPRDRFIRAHRSFIVQIKRILSMEHHVLTIDGFDKKIPVGGNFYKPLKKQLNFF